MVWTRESFSMYSTCRIGLVSGRFSSWIDDKHREETHIRMAADSLNHVLVEVTSVAQEGAGNVKGGLETLEQISSEWERTLSELTVLHVDVLHPGLMSGRRGRVYMVLENDNIRVWDFLSVAGREDGSSSVVDGAGDDR